MKSFFRILLSLSFVFLICFSACASQQGPQGPKGEKGEAGTVVTIGENGNWYLDGVDTGIKASGCNCDSHCNCNSGEGDSSLELSEYEYPIEDIVPLDGTIVSSDNKFKSISGYRGAVIKIDEFDFDQVQLTKRPGAAEMGYAFLAKELKEDFSPSYATGYTRVIWTQSQTVSLSIPDNARYLYVYNNSNSEYMLPSSIKFIKSGDDMEQKENSIRLATWNIGHFSMGNSSNSIISDMDYNSKSKDYQDYINNAINADIIALNEYSAKFTSTKFAKISCFSEYDVSYEGTQNRYSCNALYSKSSKVQLTNLQQKVFECNKNAVITHTNAIMAEDYYYLTADIILNGETIKLVSTHLAFDNNKNPDTINLAQINELIEVYNSYDRVIMMGDWNVKDFNYFKNFIDAGYSLANNDSNLYTYANENRSLDNIVYKGVTVSDFTLAGTNLSDHYGIYCTVTIDQ